MSGRGSNLQAIIDSIEKRSLNSEIALVISNKKDAPALERCKRHGIDSVYLDHKVFREKTDFENKLIKLFKDKLVQLVCLAGYMRILGKTFINAFPGKIINIHPSLLPAFPGLNAQKQALDYGVKVSGCTVHYVDEGVDSGPIILQATVPVFDNDTEESLADRILQQEHILYPKAIQLIAENRLAFYGRKIIQ